MIGMILLAVLAALIFFGATSHFFSEMGVANWVAFLVVFGVALAAVFPPLRFYGGVSFSYAGFFAPLLIGLFMFFSVLKSGGILRTLAGIPAVAGIVLAARISFPPFTNSIPSMLIIGLVGGVAAFLVGRSRIAMLASVLLGIVLGDVIATLLFRYVLGTATILPFGQYGIFDAFVLGVLVAGFTTEMVGMIAGAMHRQRVSTMPVATAIEAGKDNAFNPDTLYEDEDFDEYFNDDID
ncbi:MAG: hypothetical protein K2M95_03400 [Clostridiales bacterium]|nr:hypothetical protein [Clostridiales bacterium]